MHGGASSSPPLSCTRWAAVPGCTEPLLAGFHTYNKLPALCQQKKQYQRTEFPTLIPFLILCRRLLWSLTPAVSLTGRGWSWWK